MIVFTTHIYFAVNLIPMGLNLRPDLLTAPTMAGVSLIVDKSTIDQNQKYKSWEMIIDRNIHNEK